MLARYNIPIALGAVLLLLVVGSLGVGVTLALFTDQGTSSGNQFSADFIVAYDDFESGDLTGGFGWVDNWTTSGTVSATTADSPYEGSYHMLVDKAAETKRSVDLSGRTSMRLQFRGKVTGLTGSNQAHAFVSSNGTDWTEVRTWTSSDPSTYQYEDIDLSPYTMSSGFWVRFTVDGGGGSRSLHVDNVTFAIRQAPPPTATPTPTPTATPTPTPTATPTPTPTATPTPAPTPVAQDNFESGNLSGGTGWLDNWTVVTTPVSVTTVNSPHGGTYHMLVDKGGNVKRSVNLSGQTSMRLKFWGKVSGLSGQNKAHAFVSSDGTNWTEVKTWTSSDPTTYQSFNIDLSPYTMSSQFWVRFSVDGGGGSRSLYIDDLVIGQ